MFKKGNRLYADVYRYLRHKTRNLVALSIIGSADDYDEVEMSSPMKLDVEGNRVFFEKHLFFFAFKSLDYATIKTNIIKSRYSNDDQIALMLNKDNSEENTLLYNKMQEWRDWAGWFAKEVESMVNNVENT